MCFPLLRKWPLGFGLEVVGSVVSCSMLSNASFQLFASYLPRVFGSVIYHHAALEYVGRETLTSLRYHLIPSIISSVSGMSQLVAALNQMVTSQETAYNWARAIPSWGECANISNLAFRLAFETHMLEISPEIEPFGQFTLKQIVVSS